MALQTLVLVSNITNLSDARYCAGMGVDMLGFTIDPQDHTYTEPAAFKAITEWVAGVQRIGVLAHADAQDAQKLLLSYSLDYLMVETSADWQALHQVGIPLLCQVEVEDNLTLEWFNYHFKSIQPYVTYFVLVSGQDSLPPATVHIIASIAKEYPVILGFGIHALSIQSLLSNVPVKGIALKGSHEIRPGFKDFDDLADILELLEVEE
jgi:phosphoribosylanthranilate isomerase